MRRPDPSANPARDRRCCRRARTPAPAPAVRAPGPINERLGSWTRLAVVERNDRRRRVGRFGEPINDPEALLADGNDAEPTVVHRPDANDPGDRAEAEALLTTSHRRTAFDEHNTEAPISRKNKIDHLEIAALEDLQRKDGARKQHARKREHRHGLGYGLHD